MLLPARRPHPGSAGRTVPLQSNFYHFQHTQQEVIYKYSLKFEPELPAQITRLRERIFRKAIASSSISARFVCSNTLLFSFHSTDQEILQVTYDDVLYTLTITAAGIADSAFDSRAFYNKFFNSVQGRLNLSMIGRKFFSMSEQDSIELPHKRIKILSGYSTSVQSLAGGCMVNIDLAHRCLSTVTVLEQLEELRGPDYVSRVKSLLIGSSVITRYNNKLYRVDDVDFDSRPDSVFTDSKGASQTFHEYFRKRWHVELTRMDQPMLICKVKKIQAHLVPELCVMTGISEEVRPEVTKATKKTPSARLASTSRLVRMMYEEPKARTELETWKVRVLEEPVKLNGRVLPSGDISMGRGRSFPINPNTGRFDRDVQAEMFEQIHLKTWGIFHMRNDGGLVNSFLTTFQTCLTQFGFRASQPARFEIQTQSWGEWEATLKQKLNPNVQLIICVLPGPKNKAPLYNDLKRLLLTTYPVPSQVVLSATLKNPKNQQSIVSKILIQINAKIGGVPWAMRNPPVQNTMVAGLDLFSKRTSTSVPAFCATVDLNCSKYISVPGLSDTQDCLSLISKGVTEAFEAYKLANNSYPKHLIVYRDGVSDYQRESLLSTEVQSFHDTIQRISKETQLTFIVVNKSVSARFFSVPAENPPIGTVVDTAVVSATDYDFYLLTAKANEGSMTPTHFFVVYDNSTCHPNALQELSYRLCYAYYNWSGSVRLPAPVMYAHKLAYSLGEKATPSGPPQPHAHWTSLRSLYYL